MGTLNLAEFPSDKICIENQTYFVSNNFLSENRVVMIQYGRI